jgi:thiol-disulfide isomerase/thioredoxin
MTGVTARSALLLLVAALAAGCTSSGAGTLTGAGDNANGVAAKAGVTEWSPGERGKPVALAGDLLGGGTLDLASLRGHVVVVNVWGSWCGPCKEEAPALVAAEARLAPEGVRFVGLDTRDSDAAATQFVANQHLKWPSLTDDDGGLLLAFRGKVNPSAVPATLVIDRQGRVAARVLGAVRTDTLTAITSTVVQDK